MGFEPSLGKLALAKKTSEKAAMIAALFELDQIGAIERCRNEFQAASHPGKA